jgi:hypothetical protein
MSKNIVSRIDEMGKKKENIKQTKEINIKI